jgi:hypothetical protein
MIASLIIPFSTDRLDNLLQTLRFFCKRESFEFEIILVCQDLKNTKIDLSFIDKNYKIIDVNSKFYCRSKFINIGVANSNSEILILLDSDRILPENYFTRICKNLKENQCVTTEKLYSLDCEVSDEEIEENNLDLTKSFRCIYNQMHRRGTFSGNTVLYKRLFLKSGGMDESFVGYGYQDIDMAQSMIHLGARHGFLDDQEIHLYHGGKNADQIYQCVKNGIKYCKKWQLDPDPILVDVGRKVNIDVLKELGITPSKIVVIPNNLNGSVQHYFHFMYGYFLPFIQNTNPSYAEYLFFDCGPMNRLLSHVPLYNIKTIKELNCEHETISFSGWDLPHYPEMNIHVIKNKMFDLFAICKKPREDYVLLIDRKDPDTFYINDAEIKGSGRIRRSVPNMNEIYKKLSEYMNVKFVYLEDKPLKEQIELFYHASCVVLQHGSAMGNLLWCKPETHIVEIYTGDDYFKKLIEDCGLVHKKINQTHVHAEVNPNLVLTTMLNQTMLL